MPLTAVLSCLVSWHVYTQTSQLSSDTIFPTYLQTNSWTGLHLSVGDSKNRPQALMMEDVNTALTSFQCHPALEGIDEDRHDTGDVNHFSFTMTDFG